MPIKSLGHWRCVRKWKLTASAALLPKINLWSKLKATPPSERSPLTLSGSPDWFPLFRHSVSSPWPWDLFVGTNWFLLATNRRNPAKAWGWAIRIFGWRNARMQAKLGRPSSGAKAARLAEEYTHSEVHSGGDGQQGLKFVWIEIDNDKMQASSSQVPRLTINVRVGEPD